MSRKYKPSVEPKPYPGRSAYSWQPEDTKEWWEATDSSPQRTRGIHEVDRDDAILLMTANLILLGSMMLSLNKIHDTDNNQNGNNIINIKCLLWL